MAIVQMKDLLTHAKTRKYAVGSFNCFNIEMAQGIIDAAVHTQSPLILALSESHIKFSDWDLITYVMKNQAEKADAQIALQLDHSKTVETIEKALEAGFSSVMFDGYDLPFEEKIAQTKEIVEMAHTYNAVVEAPLGRISTVGKDTEPKYNHDDLTDPELVADFTQKSEVDILAVSVGTMHGRQSGQSVLDYDRIRAICSSTDIFISLHGGSGVGEDAYREAIDIGVEKISIFTRVSTAAVNTIKNTLAGTDYIRFPELLVEAKKGVTEEVSTLMNIFAGR